MVAADQSAAYSASAQSAAYSAGDQSAAYTAAETTMPIIDPVGSSTPQPGRSLRATLLRGGGWNTAAQLAPVAVNLVLTPYVIHGLGVARFGLYILSLSIADFLGTFDGGLYSSAQRYFAVYAGRDDRRATTRLCATLVVAVIALGAVLAGVLTLLAPLVMSLFHVPHALRAEGSFMLKILAVVIAVELLRGVFVALLNARQRFALTSIGTIGQYLFYAAGVIATVREGWGLRGIALTLLLQFVLTTLVAVAGCRRYLALSEMRFTAWSELREFVHYASRAQVAGLSDLINLQSDSMIIGGFLNVSKVTYFSSGRNFASQMRSLPWNAIAPAASALGRTYGEHGEAAVLVQFRQLQRWWVQICSGWIAVAAAAAYFGVTRWLGPGFHLAGVVAIVLLVGYLFRLWAGMLTVYCQTVGHPELEARYGVVSVIVNLALTLALVIPFGVLGVVVATAVGQLVGSLYLLRITHTRLSREVPSFLGEVPWLATIAAAVVTLGLEYAAWDFFTQGPLGLLEAGLVAIPGLVVFVIGVFGPRRVLSLVCARVGFLNAYNYQGRRRIAYQGRRRA